MSNIISHSKERDYF